MENEKNAQAILGGRTPEETLTADMQRLQTECVEPAVSLFATDVLGPCQMVASLFRGVWQKYQNALYGKVMALKSRLMTDTDDTNGTFGKRLSKTMEDKHAQIVERLTETLVAQGRKTLGNDRALSGPVRRLRQILVEMTGFEETPLVPPLEKTTADKIIDWGGVILLILLEGFAGFVIWAEGLDDNTAHLINAIAVVILTVSAILGFRLLRRYHANKEAHREFKRRYPEKNENGFEVGTFPKSDKLLMICFLFMFFATCLGVIGLRYWLFEYRQASIASFFVAIALFVFCFMFGLFEYYRSQAYSQEQYDELTKAIEAVKKLNAVDPYDAYNSAVTELENEMQNELRTARQRRDEFIRISGSWKEMRSSMTSVFYPAACNRVIASIALRFNKNGNELNTGTPECDTKLAKMLKEEIDWLFNEGDQAFMERVAGYDFVFDPPHVRKSNFADVQAETAKRLSVAGYGGQTLSVDDPDLHRASGRG